MKGGMQASIGQGSFNDGPAGYAGGAQGVLLEALHHLLQESRGSREADMPTRTSGEENRQLSQREMLSVLSLLQTTPSATLRPARQSA